MSPSKLKIMLIVFGIVLFSCSSFNKLTVGKKVLIGKWLGKIDDISIIVIFKKDSGSIEYYPYGKKFSFKYNIKNDSILTFSNNFSRSSHLIKFSTKNNFKLQPYPPKDDLESIDLINEVQFHRE